MPLATTREALVQRFREVTAQQAAAMRTVNVWADERTDLARRLVDSGLTQLEVAVMLDLTQSTMWRILHRKEVS